MASDYKKALEYAQNKSVPTMQSPAKSDWNAALNYVSSTPYNPVSEQSTASLGDGGAYWKQQYEQISNKNNYEKYLAQLESLQKEQDNAGFFSKPKYTAQIKETQDKVNEYQSKMSAYDFASSQLSPSGYATKQNAILNSLTATDKEKATAKANLDFASQYEQYMNELAAQDKRKADYDTAIAGGMSALDYWRNAQTASKTASDAYDTANDAMKKFNGPSGISNIWGGASGTSAGQAIAESRRNTDEYATLSKNVTDTSKAYNEAMANESFAKQMYYNSLKGNADYREKAVEGEELYKKSPVYETANAVREGQQKGTYKGPLADVLYGPQADWTQEELNDYYYLVASDEESKNEMLNGGYEQMFNILGSGKTTLAEQYAWDVNARHSMESNKAQQKKLTEDAYKNGAFLKGYGLGMASLATSTMNAAADLTEYAIYGNVMYTDDPTIQQKSEAIMQGESARLNDTYGVLDADNNNEFYKAIGLTGKGFGDLYQIGNSIMQSNEARLAAMASGTQVFTDVAFFSQAFESRLHQALDQGLPADKAVYVSIFNGFNEAAFEHISLDMLLKNTVPATTFKQFAKQILIQAGIEGDEEFNTTLANTFAEAILLGNKSELQNRYRELLGQGLDPITAEKQAMKEWGSQACYDFLAGAVSGGLGAGGGMVANSFTTFQGNTYEDGSTDFTRYRSNGMSKADARQAVANDFISQARNSTGEQANALASKYEGKKRLTNLQGAKLTLTVQDNVKARIREVVSEEVAYTDFNAEDQNQLVEAIQRMAQNKAEGKDLRKGLTLRQENLINSSEEITKLVNSTVDSVVNAQIGNVSDDAVARDLVERTTKTMKREEYKVDGKTVHTAGLTVNDDGEIVAQAKAGNEEGYTQISVENLPESQQEFIQAAKSMLGNEGAVAAFNEYQPNLSANAYEYLVDFQLAQTATRAGADSKSKNLQGIAKRLGTEAYKAAVASGVKLKATDSEIVGERTIKGSGKVSLNGGTVQNNGKEIKLDAVDFSKYTKAQRSNIKNQIENIRILAKGLGIDIIFYQSNRTDAEGNFIDVQGAFYDGAIYLDVNAGLTKYDSIQNATIMRTMSHELTHFIEQNDPATYRELTQYVFEHMDELSMREALAEKLNMASVGNDTRKAISEMVADGCEMMLQNSAIISQFATEHATAAQKIKGWVDRFIKNVKAIFGEANSIEAKALVNFMDGMQSKWDEGILNGIKNRNIGYAEQQVTEAMEAEIETLEEDESSFETELYEKGSTELHGVTYAVQKYGDRQFVGTYNGEDGGIKVSGSTVPMNSITDVVDALVDRATTPKKVLNDKGELVIARAADGHTLAFSERTYANGGRNKLINALRSNGHTEAEIFGEDIQTEAGKIHIDGVVETVDKILDFLQKNSKEYQKKGYDKLSSHLMSDVTFNVVHGKQVMSALVKNGDYPINLDLSLICKKRVAYMQLLNRLIEDGVFQKVDFSGKAIAEVNKILRDNGFETACLGCFVESRRLNIQSWAEQIVGEWNDEVLKRNKNAKPFDFSHADVANTKALTPADLDKLTRLLSEEEEESLTDEWKKAGTKNEQKNVKLKGGTVKDRMGQLLDKMPTLRKTISVGDLLTPNGLAMLRETSGDLFSIVKMRWGAASPKFVQEFNPYNGEVADLTFKFAKETTGIAAKGAGQFVKEAKVTLASEKPVKAKNESEEDFKKRKAAFDEKVENLALSNYLFSIGGVRIQSFSDFMIENVFDQLQIMADMAARRFPIHGYTKEQICLRLFGMTGAKWNGSWIAHVDRNSLRELAKNDVGWQAADRDSIAERDMLRKYAGLMPVGNGGIPVTINGRNYEIAMDDVERNTKTGSFIQSMGMKDNLAIILDPRYSANVGNITIGVSELQIRAMLRSPLFRMVIPYHSSGINGDYAKLLDADLYNDYEPYQETHVLKYVDANGNEIKKPAGTVDTSYSFNTELQKNNGNAKATADAYLAWCNDATQHPVISGKGKNAAITGYAVLAPKFSGIDNDGKLSGPDFTNEPNYYKLLEDFNTFDSINETAAQQSAVKMNFPTKENSLTATGQMDAYRARLEATGLFTQKEIDRYCEKADMSFEELVQHEIEGRMAYEERQKPVKDNTYNKVVEMLTSNYGREEVQEGTGIAAEAESSEKVAVFSERTKPAPKKVQWGFKLMSVDEKGLPHAMFIDAALPYEFNKWYDADSPNLADLINLEPGYAYLVDAEGNVEMDSRRPITKKASGFGGLPGKGAVNEATSAGKRWMVVSRYADGQPNIANVGINGSGTVSTFALRPGIHAVDIPSMAHIGAKGESGKIDRRRPNQRWFLIEYPVDQDYNQEAYSHTSKDIRDHLPEDGWYSFQTNSGAEKRQHWFITGAMKIVGSVSEEDMNWYINDQGFEQDLPWKDGKSYNDVDDTTVDLKKYVAEHQDTKTPSKAEMNKRIKESKDAQFSERNGMVKYNDRMLLTENTVENYLQRYAASSPNYAQAYITYMSPKEFLNLTTKDAFERTNIYRNSDGYYSDENSINEENLSKNSADQPIRISIDRETGKVDGHEGRHRMVAMMRHGIKEVPVLVVDTSTKNNKVHEDSIIVTGQFNDFAMAELKDLMPFSRANKDAILDKFTKKTTMERMQENYNGKHTVQFSERVKLKEDFSIKAPDSHFYSEALTNHANHVNKIVMTPYKGYNYYYWFDEEHEMHFVDRTPSKNIHELESGGNYYDAYTDSKNTNRNVSRLRNGQRNNNGSLLQSGRSQSAEKDDTDSLQTDGKGNGGPVINNGSIRDMSQESSDGNDEILNADFQERTVSNRNDIEVANSAFADSAKTKAEQTALNTFKAQYQKTVVAQELLEQESNKTVPDKKKVAEAQKAFNREQKVLYGIVKNNADLKNVIKRERQMAAEKVDTEYRTEFNNQYNEMSGVINHLEEQILRVRNDNKKAQSEKDREIKNLKHKLASEEKKRNDMVATRDRRIEEAKAKGKAQVEKVRQGVQNRNTREKIAKLIKDLNNRLKNPTENKYVPTEWIQPTIDLLEMLTADPWQSEQKLAEINKAISGLDPNAKDYDKKLDELITKRNRYTEREGKFNEKLAALKGIYDRYRDDSEHSRAYDESVSKMLGDLAEVVGDTPINKMNEEQLNAVYMALKAMKTSITNSIKLKIGMKEMLAMDVAKHLISEARESKQSRNNLGTQYVNDMLRPQTVFERFGGFIKNSYWSKMYDILNEGQLKQTNLKMQMSLPFMELLNDGKALRAFQGRDNLNRLDESKLVDIGLKDKDGKSIKVTHDIAVSVYLDTLNERNAKHLAEGGKIIPDLNEYYKQERDGGFGQKEIHAVGFSAELSRLGAELREVKSQKKDLEKDDPRIKEIEAEIARVKSEIEDVEQQSLDYVNSIRANIEKILTDYDRKWIKATQYLFDVQSKEALNAVTMEEYGIEKASEPNYYPIRTDSDFRTASFETVTKDMSLENVGFMKARINGANPSLALGVADMVSDQIEKTAQYCGLMPAIKNFEKAYGKTMSGYTDSVQKALKHEMGNYGQKYIDNLMGNLTGSRHGESGLVDRFFATLRGNLAQTTLTLNARTALAQAASYPTASAILGRKALAKALFSSEKVDTELMGKYSPLWWYRMQGYSTTELGDIKDSNSVTARLWKKMRWATGWIQAMDGATTKKLWLASEMYVRDQLKIAKGSENYYEEVARVYNKVIEETQPNYTTMQRPELLRNTNAIQKTLTMFMTQRLQNTSIVFDAFGRYSKYSQDFKEKKNGVTQTDVDEARNKAISAVTSQLVAAGTIVAMKFVVNALMSNMGSYRDDDKEITPESVSWALMDQLVDTIVGNVFLGSNVYSFAKAAVGKGKWYDIAFNGVDSLNSFADSIVKFANYAEGDDVEASELFKKFMSVAEDGSTMIGLPLHNAVSFVNAFKYGIQDAINGDFGTWEASVDRTKTQETHRLFLALVAGDEDKANGIIEALGGEKDAMSKVKSYIKKEYTAKHSDITEDEAIKYLVDFIGMEQPEAVSLVNYWNLLKEDSSMSSVISQSAYNKYKQYVEKTGLDARTYAETLKKADEDGNGSVSQDELRKYLNTLINANAITRAQATAIWNGQGWKKSF